MSKITTATIILLCFAIATGCWFIYGVEYKREGRELREIHAREQASLELEMYQAWYHATRFEAFKDSLAAHLEEVRKEIIARDGGRPEARKGDGGRRTSPTDLSGAVAVWVNSFQRSDVKFAGKSPKYGNASYRVSSVIIWRTRDWQMCFLSVQSSLEKMDGPGDWAVAEWKFGPIEYTSDGAYHGDAELVKRSE